MRIAGADLLHNGALSAAISVSFASIENTIKAIGGSTSLVDADAALAVIAIPTRLIGQASGTDGPSAVDDHFMAVQQTVFTGNALLIFTLA